MKKQEELFRELGEMIKETKEKKIHWTVEVLTTETNPVSEKPVEEENGIKWIVDECYISFYCKYREKEFCMITYEMLKNTSDNRRTHTINMVFLPPVSLRLFDLHTLMPYSVETSAILLDQIHKLWVLLLEMYKQNPESVMLQVSEGKMVIEA